MKTIIEHCKSFCLFAVLSLASLATAENTDAAAGITYYKITQTTTADSIKQEYYLVQIIAGVKGTYGYDIYKDKKLFIHQPTIPALPGNFGFATKTDAEKVAKLAIDKIKKGETLPTITVDELKQLKVIPNTKN